MSARRAVVALTSPRPVWSVPADVVERVRRAFGRGWEVRQIAAPISSDGDGGAASDEIAAATRGAEVYLGWGAPRGVVAAGGETLRWLHTATAGVAPGLLDALRGGRGRATLTNSRGVHAEPMADSVLAGIAYCARGFHAAVAAQQERRWAKDAFTDGTVPMRELKALRVGLLGLGGIGRAVARRAAALGMEVRGIRRHSSARRPRGVRWVGGPEDIVQLAAGSDVLVITAPRTPDTEGMVGGEVLDALPAGAFVVNVSRGELLDQRALLAALDRGHLAGCVLDVFSEEPLPGGDPLWRHPRVLITPHVSAVSAGFWPREEALLLENVRRYRVGRRLRNVVNLEKGY